MNQPLLLLWSPRGTASEFLVGAASTDEFIDWETAPLRMLATSDNLTPPQSDDEHAFRSECTAPAHELGYDLTAWALVPERTADGGARALDDRQTGGQRSEDIESVSAAAIAIAERTLGHAIGLCLLQRRAESRTRQPASFERAWAETIHGPLPRDLGRLEEARARVRAEGGPLAIMIEQWTRLSERAHVDFD